jgi:ferredoxin
MRVGLISLGCAKNLVDSERILGQLAEAGFLIAQDPASAEICLVNTCGFIGEARQEAAGVLGEAVRQGDRAIGVAIACRDSKTIPSVGEPWLPLIVPSVTMVSAGWLLQLLRVRVDARLIPCEEEHCARRARELQRFVADLKEALELSPAGSPQPGGRLEGSPLLPTGPHRIELREPEATFGALTALGFLSSSQPSWRVPGPGCSLGAVQIDAAGCSACEACGSACPTGSLRTERSEDGSFRISIDPRSCTGCGACTACCPESVITLSKTADSTLLAAGRRVVAAVAASTCAWCGQPLLAGLSPAVLRRRISPAMRTCSTSVPAIR